jgi:hypothetical protein
MARFIVSQFSVFRLSLRVFLNFAGTVTIKQVKKYTSEVNKIDTIVLSTSVLNKKERLN